MDFFEQMNFEHQKILKYMPIFREVNGKVLRGEEVPAEELQAIISFFQIYVDKFHHGKEERILFPLVHSLGLIKSGGPRCMFFFPIFLQDKYLEKAKKEISNYKNIVPYVIKEHLKSIYDDKSPLVIPLEDHEVGYYLIQLMDQEIKKKILEKDKWSPKSFFRFFSLYLDMIYMHIRKEDECLFMVLKKSLNNKQKSEITKEVEAINSDLKSEIQNVLEPLKSLEEKYKKD